MYPISVMNIMKKCDAYSLKGPILISSILVFVCIIIFSYLFFFPIPSSNDNPPSSTPWTLLIYMSGDSSLSDIASQNIAHMESVGSTEDMNIIVLVDQRGPANSHLYVVEPFELNVTSLNEMNPAYTDELNMATNTTLEDFVIWAMDEYPAEHYLLDIWGHGIGWKGVAQDGSDYLNVTELDTALSRIVEHNDGKKLDIIGFDACDMAMVEVFYQVKDYANIAIASEKEEPESGWPYYDILKTLKEYPSSTPEGMARAICKEYCGRLLRGTWTTRGCL